MSAMHDLDALRGAPMEALRGFEAAARLLNFTRAAEHLHVTQSAISHAIGSLEERLDVRLFERAGGPLRLTAAGAQLYTEVQRGLATLRRGIERVSSSGRRRTLVVSVNRPFASEWLVARLGRFMAAHTDVDLRLEMQARNTVMTDWQGLEALDDAGADLAVRLLPRSAADGKKELLLREYVFPCCTRSLANQRKRQIRHLDDLARHVLVEFDDGLPGLERLDANWPTWFKAAGEQAVAPSRWLRVPDWASIIRLGASGAGVFMGRAPLVNDLLRAELLVAPTKQVTLSARAYYIVIPASGVISAEGQAFVEWLRAEAAVETEFQERWLKGRNVAGDIGP